MNMIRRGWIRAWVIGLLAWIGVATVLGQAPQITKQPEGGFVPPGSTWVLYPSVTGALPMEFQWYKNGYLIAGETNRTLVVRNTNSWFTDTTVDYRISVKNSFGSVTSKPAEIADRVIWRREDGGNGHRYTVIRNSNGDISWEMANTVSRSFYGYLACIGSRTENDFIFRLAASSSSYWVDRGNGPIGPWLGGIQDASAINPAEGWGWVTGEPWVFTAWRQGSTGSEPTGGGERFLSFTGQLTTSPQPYWNNNLLSNGSRSFCVEFNDVLSIYSHPKTVTVRGQGEEVRFEVLASSFYPVKFQWLRDGQSIGGETNSVLVLKSAVDDTSQYSCLVFDGIGQVESLPARILIPPLVRSRNLTNFCILEGGGVLLSLDLLGRPPFEFQWFRNSSPIKNATNSVLSLEGLSLDQSAGYHAEIRNPDGFVATPPSVVSILPLTHSLVYQTDFESFPMPSGWSAARRSFTPDGSRRFLGEFGNSAPRLTLNNLPPHTHLTLQFDLYLMRGIAPRGPALAFRELTSGYERRARFSTLGGLNYQDYPGPFGESLASGTAGAVERHTLGYNHERIEGRDVVQRITVNLAHSGPDAVFEFAGTGWSALTSGSWGIDNVVVSSANPPAFSPPVLVNAPQSQVVHERWQTAVFQAGAVGPGPLSYQWLRDGQPILGATNDYLILPPATPDQVGLYGVRVSNDNGSVVRNTARLAVVTRMPESITATAGIPAELEAAAVGNPGFQWFRNGQSVAGATTSRMRWDNPRPEDGGDWSVRVFLDGASLDRYWGPNNTYDANYPQVAVVPSGAPGQLLWSHRRPVPVLQDGFEAGAIRSPAMVLSNEVVATPLSQGVVGLDSAGQEIWKNSLGAEWNFGSATADPEQGIAIVSEIHAYRGESDVHCFDLKTGQTKWVRSIPGAVVSGASIGVDGTVYVGTIRLGTEKNSRLYALDREGIVIWSAETQNLQNQPAIAADGTIYTTESVAEGIEREVVRIRAFNPDGSVKWVIAPGVNVFSSPAIAADGTVYVNLPSGEFVAIHPDGSRKWTFKPHNGGWESTPVIDSDGNIYLGYGTTTGGSSSVVSINPEGRLRWQASVESDVWGSLAVAADGTVYGWANRGFLFALDRDGQLLWKAPTPKLYGLANPPVPILGMDGTVYLTGASQYQSGYVQAFRGTAGPGNGQWPMLHGNASNTGRAPLRWLPQNGNLSLGAPLQLKVESREPGVRFRWTKDGREIQGATNSVFRLDRVQPEDAGEYQVSLIGSQGSILGPNQTVAVDSTFERVISNPVVGEGVYTGANWGDFDGDGLSDLLLPNPSRSPFLFRNLGAGRFEPWAPSGIVDLGRWESEKGLWADWNNDGLPELTMLDFGGEGRVFGLTPGATNYVRLPSPVLAGITAGWAGAAAADYDLDGNLDFFAVQLTWPFENPGPSSPTNNVLLRGLGNGDFERITNQAPVLTSVGAFGASWCDYDNDGDPDLFVAHHVPAPWGGSRRNFLFRNDGTNGFSKPSVGIPVTNTDAGNDSPVWADFDNDGDFDLLVTRSGGSAHQLYRNEAGVRFVLHAQWLPSMSTYTDSSNAAWGDLDNDGWIDAVVTGNKGMPALVMRNLGGGIFERQILGSLGSDTGNSTAVTLVDDNNDGRLDVFIANYGGGNFYYRNQQTVGAWLKVRTHGVVSNRGGVGAKVRAVAVLNGVERTLLRQITAGDGGGNQGGWEAHFGLADATQVSRLRIEWPSGQTQERSGVATRQILTVTESTLALPRSAAVQWGGEITLAPVGAPPEGAVFEWLRDGVAIPGATARTLALVQVTPDQAARYHLRAVGASETVTTAPMVLTVVGPEPFASRRLPAAYWPDVPLLVSLRLAPSAGVVAQAFEDQPPQGWTVTVASDGGQWDPLLGRVKFGPYFDDQARDLSYTVVPGPGLAPTAVFSGTAAADDLTTPVMGQREIPLGPVHPADRNPFDGQIVIGEMTTYASAWRRGTSWPAVPQEIPIAYVTRAGYAWRHGETYWYDLREPSAPGWWKASTEPKGVPRTVGPAGATEIGAAERRVPADWTFPAALMVTLQVDPVPTAASVAVEERIPSGWRAEEPNEGGSVDDSGRWLRWGPFFDANHRTLRYRLVPTASAEAGTPLEGVLSVDGLDAAIGGVVRIPQVSGVAPGIRVRSPFAGGPPGLEIVGETGAELMLEVSADLRSWSTVQRVVGQGMDRPVAVDLTEDPAFAVRFWRVRR